VTAPDAWRKPGAVNSSFFARDERADDNEEGLCSFSLAPTAAPDALEAASGPEPERSAAIIERLGDGVTRSVDFVS
jgi:hypothetical protein